MRPNRKNSPASARQNGWPSKSRNTSPSSGSGMTSNPWPHVGSSPGSMIRRRRRRVGGRLAPRPAAPPARRSRSSRSGRRPSTGLGPARRARPSVATPPSSSASRSALADAGDVDRASRRPATRPRRRRRTRRTRSGRTAPAIVAASTGSVGEQIRAAGSAAGSSRAGSRRCGATPPGPSRARGARARAGVRSSPPGVGVEAQLEDVARLGLGAGQLGVDRLVADRRPCPGPRRGSGSRRSPGPRRGRRASGR